MVSGDDLAYEQSRVDAAYKIADEKAGILRDRIADPSRIQAGDNKTADALLRGWRSQLDQLDHLLQPDSDFLLFGRVDFSSTAELDGLEGQTYYVGLASLRDVREDPMVVAWESGVGSAFSDPEGFAGGGAVHRRRQFEGQDRRLLDFRDVVLDGGVLQPGSGDPLLERLKGTTTGHMHQVVATIQAEQRRLMEFPADRTLVVQGGPGTGKTIVGLHRVSVLIFQSDGLLTEGDILVVGPSDVFMKYIERVLPSLGRQSVQHRPIYAIGGHGITPRGRDAGLSARVKGDEVMARVIASYLDQRINRNPDELKAAGVTLKSARLSDVLAPLEEQLPYMRKRDRVKERLRELVGARDDRADKSIDNAVNRIIPARSEREVVNDLLTGPKLLADAAGELLSPEEQAAILREARGVNEAAWTSDDVPLLDEALVLLSGPSAIQRYRHIVVDEAQDLSPMQLRMLARRQADDGAMTILGDLAQNTSPWSPMDWESHLLSGGIEFDEHAELTKSYRIPGPILDYANRLLKVIDVMATPTTSVIEVGDEPAVLAEATSPDVYVQSADVIDSMIYTGSDDGQIGVIGLPEDLRGLSEALDERNIEHTWAARSISTPVTLVPADEAKGLEFNRIVVLEPGKLYRQDRVLGPRSLYVAMTRAKDELTLVHSTPLPPVLFGGPDSGIEEVVRLRNSEGPTPATSGVAATSRAPAELAPEPGWQRFVTVGQRLVQVMSTAGDQVLVNEVPVTGGGPVPLARGYVVAGVGESAWALRTATGRAVAITVPGPTADGIGSVADAVAAAAFGSHPVSENR